MLAEAGAAGIALMFDDIEPVAEDIVAVREEMAFHADIATRISAQITIPTLFVPRVYADEISPHAASARPDILEADEHELAAVSGLRQRILAAGTCRARRWHARPSHCRRLIGSMRS